MHDLFPKGRPPGRRSLSVSCVLLFLLSASPSASAEDHSFGFDGETPQGASLPEPWQIAGHPTAGEPRFTIVEDDQMGRVVRGHAQGKQADAVFREVEVDLAKTPFLSFAWKVDMHPKAQIGTSKNDQAVKVQVDFGRFRVGLFRVKRRMLSYTFDPAAEKGKWFDDSSFVAANQALVLDSGSDQLGQWLSHSRNVAEDYRAKYGSEPPTVKHISIFCDSNDSDSESIGYCACIRFSTEEHKKSPSEGE